MITNTTGVNLPDEFDVATFDAVSKLLGAFGETHPSERSSFAAAWNAVGFRFRAAYDYSREFTASISQSVGPGGDERYRQDHCIFGFTTSALSTLECICFAAYCIGSIASPSAFPVTTAKDLRQIKPEEVARRFRAEYPQAGLTVEISEIIAAPGYTDLGELRNFLSHRGSLPRQFRMSSPSTAFIPDNPKDVASDWRITRVLGPQLTSDLMQFVSTATTGLIAQTLTFAEAELRPTPSAAT
jgi:hypothetical protein